MSNCAQNVLIDHRLASIARILPHQVALVKLSKTQLKVFNEIEQEELVTPEQIASRCDVSTSWASTLLRRLYEKAYLSRRQNITPGGGITYTYQRCG